MNRYYLQTFLRVIVCLLIVFLALGAEVTFSQENEVDADETIQEIIKLDEARQELIKSISVDVKRTIVRDSGTEVKEEHYSKDGARYRFQYTALRQVSSKGKDEPTFREAVIDVYCDPDRHCEVAIPKGKYPFTGKLNIYDFQKYDQEGFDGFIEKRADGDAPFNGERDNPWLKWCDPLRYGNINGARDFFEKYKPQLLSRTVDNSGDVVATFVSEGKNPNGLSNDKVWKFEISVNISKGGLVVKNSVKWLNNASKSSLREYITEGEITEFRQDSNIWFPALTKTRILSNGENVQTGTTEVFTLSVNEDLSSKINSFDFPEGMVVSEYFSNNETNPMYNIWGCGKPAITFTNKKEFFDYLRNALSNVNE